MYSFFNITLYRKVYLYKLKLLALQMNIRPGISQIEMLSVVRAFMNKINRKTMNFKNQLMVNFKHYVILCCHIWQFSH